MHKASWRKGLLPPEGTSCIWAFILENGHRQVQNLSERDTTLVDILELFVLYIFPKYKKEMSFMAAPEMTQIKPTDKN